MAADARSTAANVLALVIGNGKSLDVVLEKAFKLDVDTRDRAFIQELVYGVLRWYWRLQPQLQSLISRPLRDRDRDVEMLLMIGLYQLQYLSTPSHAAVSATVEACSTLKKPWAKGLINATLRNAIRKSDKLGLLASDSAAIEMAHPEWLVNLVRRDWPGHWQQLLAANNERPPFTLRINEQKISRDNYLKLLAEVGIAATKSAHSEQGVRLEIPVGIESLPDFDRGSVSIQDEAAQLAKTVLDLPSSGAILDACAAPGGKTAHILESGQLRVVALDRSAQRMSLLRQSMERLNLQAEIKVVDAIKVHDWWDGTQFDRILLDAPCSGSGVIRRHPDIKLHRRHADIANLAGQQLQLIQALWPLLKPGGKLVYATCSILRAENDEVIERFISAADAADLESIDVDWGVPTDFGRQTLTGDDHMDGFFYARLAKH
ncbi:MAG: 16S rRNA (cytosine(967)-C(5))-methyltransferase RsmB [Proteobacteria bacterium]|nr:16S rRNA (cytosine(967)-C(5))-methyltransferase RsmB [Pseudomonadota bacterium]